MVATGLGYSRAAFQAILTDPPDVAEHGKLFSELEALAFWDAAARDEVGRIMTKCRELS